MTIRYKCDSCSSKLNIKDELAGTKGKCPKCKKAFTVPQPDSAQTEAVAAKVPPASESAAPSDVKASAKQSSGRKGRLSAKEKLTAKAAPKPSANDDEFDPVAFLMEDEPQSGPQRGVSALSDDEIPMDLELELSDDDPPPAKRNRRRIDLDSDAEMQMGSAAASAGAMLSDGGSSASAAKDLLTRTVEESRARSSRIEEDEPEPSVAKEVVAELFTRGLPGLVAIGITVFGLYYLTSSAISGREYPELGYVYGTVTLDGKPLAGARVAFAPKEKTFPITESRTIKVRSSKAFTDAEGYYVLKYDQDVEGASVGQHAVRISKRDGPRDLVPVKYSGPISTVLQTVEEGSQEINFAIESEN